MIQTLRMPPDAYGSIEEQVKDIRDYLRVMSRQYVTSANVAEVVFQTAADAMASGSEAAKQTGIQQYGALRDLIIKTAKEIRVDQEEIHLNLDGKYVAISDFGTYFENARVTIDGTPIGITQLYNFSAGIRSDMMDVDVQQQTYIKTGLLFYDGIVPRYGVGIGELSTKVDEGGHTVLDRSGLMSTLTADEIAFWRNNVKMMWMDIDTGLHVPAASIDGTLTASQIDATNLHISAANIDGTLTIGQLPTTVALKSEIPTNNNQLINGMGFQDATGVTTISTQVANGRIVAVVNTDFVEALGIHIGAAQIDDRLTIGQLPSTVAEISDIPTDNSELTNGAGYQSQSGVTTIIGNTVDTGFVNALHVTAGSVQSSNYRYSSGYYSTSGARFDYTNGWIRTPGFYSDNNGTHIKGEVTATSGAIGQLSISSPTSSSSILQFGLSNADIFRIETESAGRNEVAFEVGNFSNGAGLRYYSQDGVPYFYISGAALLNNTIHFSAGDVFEDIFDVLWERSGGGGSFPSPTDIDLVLLSKYDVGAGYYWEQVERNSLFSAGWGLSKSGNAFSVNTSTLDGRYGRYVEFIDDYSHVCDNSNRQLRVACGDQMNFRYNSASNTLTLEASLTCLIEGTMVRMADGTEKPIEQVKAGDIIDSYDLASGQHCTAVAVDCFRTGADRVFNTLVFDDEHYIEFFGDHEIYNARTGDIKNVKIFEAGKDTVLKEDGTTTMLAYKTNINHHEYRNHYVLVSSNCMYWAGGILMGHYPDTLYQYGREQDLTDELHENISELAVWGNDNRERILQPDVIHDVIELAKKSYQARTQMEHYGENLKATDYVPTKIIDKLIKGIENAKNLGSILNLFKELIPTEEQKEKLEQREGWRIVVREHEQRYADAEAELNRYLESKGIDNGKYPIEKLYHANAVGNEIYSQYAEWAESRKQ